MAEIVAGANIVIDDTTPGSLKVRALQQKEFAFFGPLKQRMPVRVPMVVGAPQLDYDGASAPTYTVGKASSFTGTVTAIGSFPAGLAAGEYLVVQVTNFADATEVWLSFPLVEL